TRRLAFLTAVLPFLVVSTCPSSSRIGGGTYLCYPLHCGPIRGLHRPRDFVSILFRLCSFFFFSSRRRHTRFSRDWSSDVCSSDLFRCRQLHHRHCTAGRRWQHLHLS